MQSYKEQWENDYIATLYRQRHDCKHTARTESHLLLIKILFCQVRQTPLWKTTNKMIQIKSFKSKPLQDQCSPSGFEANTGSQSGLPGTETNDPWCWKYVTPRQSVNVQCTLYMLCITWPLALDLEQCYTRSLIPAQVNLCGFIYPLWCRQRHQFFTPAICGRPLISNVSL